MSAGPPARRADCPLCQARDIRLLPTGRLSFHHSNGPGLGSPCFGPTAPPTPPTPKEIEP